MLRVVPSQRIANVCGTDGATRIALSATRIALATRIAMLYAQPHSHPSSFPVAAFALLWPLLPRLAVQLYSLSPEPCFISRLIRGDSTCQQTRARCPLQPTQM
eukprot:1515499-Rhodomonas_salina.1